MMKVRAYIYFKEGYDWAAVADVGEDFPEVDLWYDDNYARFQGLSERLQEYLRAIKNVEEVVNVTIIHPISRS